MTALRIFVSQITPQLFEVWGNLEYTLNVLRRYTEAEAADRRAKELGG